MTETDKTTTLARENWNADRAWLRINSPAWEMPAWSRAPAWRRRPYLMAAQHGERPE